jgi:hypothetical protein
MVNGDVKGLAIHPCSFLRGATFIKESARKNKTVDYWLESAPFGENSLARSTGRTHHNNLKRGYM